MVCRAQTRCLNGRPATLQWAAILRHLLHKPNNQGVKFMHCKNRVSAPLMVSMTLIAWLHAFTLILNRFHDRLKSSVCIVCPSLRACRCNHARSISRDSTQCNRGDYWLLFSPRR